MLKLNKNIRYYNFSITTEFHYEVMESNDLYEVYIYHNQYGLKQHIFGMEKDSITFTEIMEYLEGMKSTHMLLYREFLKHNGLV